jgi:MFS family permease
VHNYRLFFYGQLLSMVGTWMQSMVQSWLVFRLTGSALWLGIITASMQGTAFVASPFAGVLVDRFDRRKLLIWIEFAAMIQALLLATLVFTGAVRIWQIAALSALLGIANAFESTTRHAFAVDLVGKADLPSAISLNTVTINASRIVGPSIAGALIAIMGNGSEGWCFLINALSFIAVIACLLWMDPAKLHRKGALDFNKGAMRFRHQLTQGLHYVRKKPQIRNFLLFTTFMAFVGFPYAVVLPVIATQVLHGDAHTYGWLTGACGIGSLFGGLSSSRPRRDQDAIWRKLLGDLFFLGLSYIALSFSHALPISLLAAAALGYFVMGTFPLINSTIQSLVDDSVRGRVVSLYTMSFLGAGPLGSLVLGGATDRAGVTLATSAFGMVCVTAAIGAAWVRRVRRGAQLIATT